MSDGFAKVSITGTKKYEAKAPAGSSELPVRVHLVDDVNKVRHVIMAEPLRCFGQMMTGGKLAEAHKAMVHLTTACIGVPTRKRPGMATGCAPGGTCRCDLAALRAEGAIDITADTPCDTSPCSICGSRWAPLTMTI